MKNTGDTPLNERLVLSIEDASRYIGLSKTSIYNLLEEGEFGSFKVGKRRLIRREELDAFVARQVPQEAA
jgi:excisionase family DNA binding protein